MGDVRDAGSEMKHPEVRYERSDFNLRALIWVAIGVLVFAAAVHILLWLLFEALTHRQARLTVPPPPLADQPRGPFPPEPRLQPSPRRDLQAMRAEEEAMLHSYDWVDRQVGIVRIPIGRAMELVVERGLPAWHAPEGEPHERAPGATGTPPAGGGLH